jgi:hypothetical protein
MKAEIVGAICNEWQDAKKGPGWKWTVSMNGWMLCMNVDDIYDMYAGSVRI